jgi:hypothetical protein
MYLKLTPDLFNGNYKDPRPNRAKDQFLIRYFSARLGVGEAYLTLPRYIEGKAQAAAQSQRSAASLVLMDVCLLPFRLSSIG